MDKTVTKALDRSLDRPLLGIALMLGFCIAAPFGDALVKLIGDRLPVLELLLLRFVLQAVYLFPVVWLTGRPWRMAPRELRFTLYRTLFHIGGMGFMFTALRYLDLADAVAICFVMPFIMLLLGWFYLDEEVGTRRLIACAVGFAGTLMVIQPSFVAVGWPALLPLGVAVCFSCFMLVTRQIARDVDPIGMQAVSGLMATGLLLPLALLGRPLGMPELTLVMPGAELWGIMLVIGAIGSFGHLLMTWSLRYAPAATLAPMQYLEIPFSALIGLMMFGDFPDGLALAGITVTMGSGLYIIWREQATARRSRAAPPPLPPAPPPAI